jgi:hypothetical protein
VQESLALLRVIQEAHTNSSQRCTLVQLAELTKKVLGELLQPTQAALALTGAMPGVLDVWELLLLVEGWNYSSMGRQVTTM